MAAGAHGRLRLTALVEAKCAAALTLQLGMAMAAMARQVATN